MKAAIKATAVFFGFPGLLWALVAFPLAREIALWAGVGAVLAALWLGLFITFGGLDD